MRKIIHCDFDCFYAAIETRDNPELKGKAIAIGGSPEGRGVVATCSYEARDYGIHSAMASAQALKLCPQLILIKPDMQKYREVSKQAHQIFRQYSETIEPIALDEAFLDVSNSSMCKGSATLMAEAMRKEIEEQLGITASAGIAPNKFLAKIASDWKKPNGQFTIKPEEIETFMPDLPVSKIFGVGKVTQKKMLKQGIKTCGDLQKFSKQALAKQYGIFGPRLYELCRGIDERPVNPSRIRKSISVENTYVPDIKDIDEAILKFNRLEKELFRRFENISDNYLCTGIFVKLKFSDFSQTTMENQHEHYDRELAIELLKSTFKRKALPVRLIGLGMKLKPAREANDQQLELI